MKIKNLFRITQRCRFKKEEGGELGRGLSLVPFVIYL